MRIWSHNFTALHLFIGHMIKYIDDMQIILTRNINNALIKGDVLYIHIRNIYISFSMVAIRGFDSDKFPLVTDYQPYFCGIIIKNVILRIRAEIKIAKSFAIAIDCINSIFVTFNQHEFGTKLYQKANSFLIYQEFNFFPFNYFFQNQIQFGKLSHLCLNKVYYHLLQHYLNHKKETHRKPAYQYFD